MARDVLAHWLDFVTASGWLPRDLPLGSGALARTQGKGRSVDQPAVGFLVETALSRRQAADTLALLGSGADGQARVPGHEGIVHLEMRC